jgi:hypothetical protein
MSGMSGSNHRHVDDLLIARGVFLSLCRDGSEVLQRYGCDRLVAWVWNHFQNRGTGLQQQVGTKGSRFKQPFSGSEIALVFNRKYCS